jgi:DNA-binding NtrC family response regulator
MMEDMVRETKPKTNTPAVVLLVMPFSERRSMLLSKLESVDAKFLAAENCRDVRTVLRDQVDVNVIVTDTTLTDGSWCDVLNHVAHLGSRANVVVTSEVGDERLWSEVLWRGAYDLLLEPVEAREVRQVMEGALRTGLSSLA